MSNKKELTRIILEILPPPLSREIEAISAGRSLCEVRIRRYGRSSIVLSNATVPLATSVGDSIDGIFMSVCRGTPYAYRESIERGYIPFHNGIRVGVVGRARYDGERLVGISEVSSLVFRIPSDECDFADELYEIWRRSRGGMLIYSSPGGGKTTALRSLAARIASGRSARRVVIVDEREEIFSDALLGLEVDVLSGYRRAYGISLATRTMSPEIIVTDEIAPEDAGAILRSINSGVPIIASAHAGSSDELMRREDIIEFIKRRVFESFVELARVDGHFLCREVRLGGE